MGRIGLVQVDGKIPNMALMQISQFHEAKGDIVEWWKGPLWNEQYEKIYASKIFSFSKWPELPPETIKGGTGIDWTNRLPNEIESTPPSYTLYPNCNYNIGFSMKGCRFKCKFCVVPQKEGNPWHNADIRDILLNPNGGNRLMLLDNDFFGGPRWEHNIKELIRLKLKTCFVQGLNIRIITERQAEYLSQVKYTNSKFNQKYLTFAWDRTFDERLVMKGIDICVKAGIPTKNMQFFVLIGYKSTPEQDLYRVTKLRDIGAMPFVMPYNKSDKYQASFARWVNHRATFKTTTWEEYKYK